MAKVRAKQALNQIPFQRCTSLYKYVYPLPWPTPTKILIQRQPPINASQRAV